MTGRPITAERSRSIPALLAVLMAAVLVTVTSSDMVNLMLPSIGADFGASEAELAWIVTGFLLMFAIGVPLYGRLADRIGLRRLFAAALATYAAGSLICALAPELAALVGGRIVAGAGAAAIPVLSVVAVTRLVPPEKRTAAIGVVSAAAGIGTAAGPAVGGGIGQLFGWPALFWIMVPVAAALLIPVWRILPDEAPASGTPSDLLGGALLGLGAGLPLFGMTQAQVSGFAAVTCWGSLVVAIAALALFGWRTARAPHPFIPPSLFTNPAYRTAVLVVFLAMTVNLGGLVFVPLLVVEVHGLTPGSGALVMIPAGIAVAALSPLLGRLARRFGTTTLVSAGLALTGLSSVFLSGWAGGSVVAAGTGILGISLGFILVLATLIDTAAGELPTEQTGAGIGILQGAQFLGAGTGPALFGVLVSTRQDSANTALNPIYSGSEGAAYSDAFLAMAAVTGIALLFALRLRPTSVDIRRRESADGPGHAL
ncbi:MFS transporter [Nocardia sp. NPDC058499]|uniref:MFS transporter n=1 Tax=Nocardia sp. NPDC058499 TaxID=3346530 RepID=UPI003656FFDC